MEKDIKLKLRLSRMDRSLLVAVPVTMILVFFALLAMLSAYQREAVVSTVRVSHTLAANQRNQLDVYLVGRVEMLKLLAQQPDVYSMNLERQRAFAARWTASSGFSHLFFVDNNGQGWYPLENGGTYRNQAGEPFFQDISTHDVFVTDPFLKDDGPITTVCVAIRRPDGTRAGTLCGAFYLSNVQNVIDDNQVIYGGKCYVLDKEGRHISLDGDNSWSYDSLTGGSDAEVALLEQVYESGDDLDGKVKIDGADQYASIAVLSKAPWVVMVCVPAAEVTRSTVWMERALFVIAVLALLMLFALAHILRSWQHSDEILYTDPLCPCGSRTAMQQLLERLEPRRDISVTVLYADLNRFKYVNDTFGHEQGDLLLITFARVLSRVFDGTLGFTARAGGDEFVVIMTEVSEAVVLEAWQQVELELIEESRRLPYCYWITSSHGVATRAAGEEKSLEALVREADQAMYLCKQKFKKEMHDMR